MRSVDEIQKAIDLLHEELRTAQEAQRPETERLQEQLREKGNAQIKPLLEQAEELIRQAQDIATTHRTDFQLDLPHACGLCWDPAYGWDPDDLNEKGWKSSSC